MTQLPPEQSPYIIGSMPPAEQTAGDRPRPLLYEEAVAERTGSAALDGVHVITPGGEGKATERDPSASLGLIGGDQAIGKPIEHTPHQEPGLIIGRNQ